MQYRNAPATRSTAPGPTPTPSASAAPRRLATFARTETEELRFEACTYEGKQFIGARIWFKGTDGAWYPTKKGISIRRRELPEVLRALAAEVAP